MMDKMIIHLLNLLIRHLITLTLETEMQEQSTEKRFNQVGYLKTQVCKGL